MNVITLQAGPILVNTYILHQAYSREAIIIDPGGESNRIKKVLKKNNLEPKAILLTHGHYDHIEAVKPLKQAYGLDVYIHKDDAELLTDGMKNLSSYMFSFAITCDPPDCLLEDNQMLDLCDIQIKVLHTPGHAYGAVVYLIENAAFTGDTLFNMTIGRLDLWGGDEQMMKKSLERLKWIIPPNCTIYPGHGAASTFKFELENNPYLLRWVE